MKAKISVLLIVFLATACSKKQHKPSIVSSELQTALDSFPEIEKAAKHKILTLGTFHFDRSMDGSDIIAKKHIDITSATNQLQLDSLIHILKDFNPTKIAVEWKPRSQKKLDSLFSEYKKGKWKLRKNEAYQIGFRLAKLLGHKKVYCVDNNPPMPETVNSIDDWDQYAKELGHFELWHAYDIENEQFYNFIDTIQNNLYVFDYIRLLNSKVYSNRNKQIWTTGLVNVGHGDKYLGADLLGRW